MELILDDIQRSLAAKASYAALAAVVTLPEICMRCELPDAFSTKGPGRSEQLFVKFVYRYLNSWSIGLNGVDLYNLRNGVSHRGSFEQRTKSVRYVFTPPNDDGNVCHDNRGLNENGETEVLNIDLGVFCKDISNAVRKWMEETKDNALVQQNLKNIIQTRDRMPGNLIQVSGMRWLA